MRGNAIDIKGKFYKNGELQDVVSTLHRGMGIINMIPEMADYTFKVTSPRGVDSIYHLPIVKKEGYMLSYLGQNEAIVKLSLSHNLEGEHSGRLWVSYCDSLLFVHDFKAPSVSHIPLSKVQLPNGIVTFTFSDENNVPQAERLVYVEKKMPKLDISFSQTKYKEREKVDMTIVLDSSRLAHLSCAVVDSVLANSADFGVTNLKAYAELESELKGYVPHLNQYIGEGRSIANRRDLLLMTHGWRRFDWFNNNEVYASLKVHDFNRVFGNVTRLGKPYPKASVGAYVLGESIAFSEFMTDDNGRFFLDPAYEMFSYKDMMIVASNKKGRSGVTLSIKNTDTLLFASIASRNGGDLLLRMQPNLPMEDDDEPVVVKEPFMVYNTHTLKEFEISADRRDWDMSRYLSLSEDIKLGVDMDEFESFEWLLTQTSNSIFTEGDSFTGPRLMGPDGETFPDPLLVRSQCAVVMTSNSDRIDFEKNTDEIGLFESYIEEELYWLYNEANPPSAMIFVNDKPLGYDLTILDYLRKKDIIAVAVLDGVKAYERFGTEAYYGAIMVYVSPAAIKKQRLKNNQVLFGDFVAARKFPEQLYESKEYSKTVAEDKRVTLHWEPLLQTDKNGKAKVSFYTGDIPGMKQVVIQGFDDMGNLYYQTGSFVVSDLFDK